MPSGANTHQSCTRGRGGGGGGGGVTGGFSSGGSTFLRLLPKTTPPLPIRVFPRARPIPRRREIRKISVAAPHARHSTGVIFMLANDVRVIYEGRFFFFLPHLSYSALFPMYEPQRTCEPV